MEKKFSIDYSKTDFLEKNKNPEYSVLKRLNRDGSFSNEQVIEKKFDARFYWELRSQTIGLFLFLSAFFLLLLLLDALT